MSDIKLSEKLQVFAHKIVYVTRCTHIKGTEKVTDNSNNAEQIYYS